jgi:hypothetical protein
VFIVVVVVVVVVVVYFTIDSVRKLFGYTVVHVLCVSGGWELDN